MTDPAEDGDAGSGTAPPAAEVAPAVAGPTPRGMVGTASSVGAANIGAAGKALASDLHGK